MLEYLELSKFVTSISIAIVIWLGKVLYSFITRNGEKMRLRSASVELIERTLSDKDWKNGERRLIAEEAFELLFRRPLNFHEIKILLYSDTPSAAFRTYLKYRPILEFNEKKTKFKFRDGKKPWPYIFGSKIKYPRTLIKSLAAYFVVGTVASLGSHWLINLQADEIPMLNFIIYWCADILLWLIAILCLIFGMQYQGSEKEILTDLHSVFIS